MSLGASPLNPFGSQAMEQPHFLTIMVKEDDEYFLVIIAMFCRHDLLDLSRFDIVLVVNLKLFKPLQEVHECTSDLVFLNDRFNDAIIDVHFQYVLEKDS